MTQEVLVEANPANYDLLNKLMTAPVMYVQQDPKCSCCPDTFKVYIHAALITDKNFALLKDPLFNVVDDTCCKCSESCSQLNFHSAMDNSIQYNVAPMTCCERCCAECCAECCKPKKCCDCSCVSYGPPLFASFGNTQNFRFGRYSRRYALCSCCESWAWEFFGKMGDSRYIVEVDCCESFNPCINNYPLHFHIKYKDQRIGVVTRSPMSCCGTFTYEIQFPNGLTLEDRLLLIAFCCKQV